MTNQGTPPSPEGSGAPARKMTTDVRSAAGVIQEAVPELKARVRDMVDTGRNRVTEWRDEFEDGIREKPIQYVLMAAGVGAIVGLLFARR